MLTSAGTEVDEAAWAAAAEMVRTTAASPRHTEAAKHQVELIATRLAHTVAPDCRVEIQWIE